MPHWATGVQSLVNGWVKVNIKHGGLPQGHGEGHPTRRESDGQISVDRPRTPPSSVQNGNVPKPKDMRDHASHNTTSTEPASLDPENLAIRKYNSKHGRRRLQKSISHSDLLREMAGDAKKSSDLGRSRDRESSNHGSDEFDGSGQNNRRPVTGMLGSHELNTKPSESRQRRPVTTGKYLNEAMFVQQLERTKTHQRSLSSGGGSEFDLSSHKRPARPTDASQHEQYYRHRAIGDMDGHGSHYYSWAAERLQYSGSQKETPARQPYASHSHAGVTLDADGVKNDLKRSCRGCNEMESRLLSAYEDIRYLHDVALRHEFSRDVPKPKTNSLRVSHHEVTTLADASKRLTELTARHRRQIEQITRETSRKQHDMHFKHSKISMICKELNEESSTRKQEAVTLEADVRELKIERDSLATQVQQLRAEVSLHEQERQEHRLLREKITQYENGALDHADEAIRERDELIVELSMRLERTMETLEMEREQQRQRRQIIFPVAKTTPEIPSSKCVAALEEELRIAKEAQTSSQNVLEASKKEAAKREATLIARCEELARRLKKENPPSKGRDDSCVALQHSCD